MAGSPVGYKDVVKMEYEIGYGTFDSGMEGRLAWTDSFKQGITLSDIQWSFVNTATDKGDETEGKISFTLHDIAGLLFEQFMYLKLSAKYIYFIGPKTSGEKWGGTHSLYQVDKEACSMEFSQTQGFTYTFAGTAAAAVSKSNIAASPYEFTLTNVLSGTYKTFKDIVEKELVKQWNDKIEGEKAGTAKIKVEVSPTDELNDKYHTRPPLNNDTQGEGAPGGTFQYSVKQGTTIYDAISKLWTQVFQNASDVENRVRLRVDFHKWEGGDVALKVFFTDKSIEDSIVTSVAICVGDDDNCKGWPYRGELASIDFKEISKTITYLGEKKPPAYLEGASGATDIAPPEKDLKGGELQSK
jgi:hypothetical protein